MKSALLLTLIACLAASALPVAAQETPRQSTDVWDSVRGLPPGTRVRLILHDGAEITGTVVETRLDTVVMKDNHPGRAGVRISRGSSFRGRSTFTRSDVAGVSVLEVPRWYRASGATDPVAVRYVVAELGIGRKIDLTRSNGSERMRVRIRSIEQNGFTYVHGFRSAVDSIAYGDVSQMKPAGMHWAVRVAIVYFSANLVVAVIAGIALSAAG